MIRFGALFVGLGLAVCLPGMSSAEEKEAKKVDNRVFELRTYYALPGRMKALHDRFSNHTVKLFEKHGMTIIGFWVPRDSKGAEEKLVYMLAYPSKEAADKAWAGFRTDPVWMKARDESEKDGKIVAKIESVYLNPVDYSPLK